MGLGYNDPWVKAHTHTVTSRELGSKVILGASTFSYMWLQKQARLEVGEPPCLFYLVYLNLFMTTNKRHFKKFIGTWALLFLWVQQTCYMIFCSVLKSGLSFFGLFCFELFICLVFFFQKKDCRKLAHIMCINGKG